MSCLHYDCSLQYSARDHKENVVLSASLRKLNKLHKRWFVLYSGSKEHPAHLEYYDNDAKWKNGDPPKREILLETCFNICRKKDSRDSMNRFVIAIYTLGKSNTKPINISLRSFFIHFQTIVLVSYLKKSRNFKFGWRNS